jgi:hypothetical protein
VVYAQPREFSVRVRKGTLTAQRLLIPLEPIHAETVIIYHGMDNYSAGPLLNIKGKAVTDRLQREFVDKGYMR